MNPRPHDAASAERGEMILRASGYDEVSALLADIAAYADREGLLTIEALASVADIIHTTRVLDALPDGRARRAELAAVNATRRD